MNDSIPPAVAPARSEANGFSFAFPFAVDEDISVASMRCSRVSRWTLTFHLSDRVRVIMGEAEI